MQIDNAGNVILPRKFFSDVPTGKLLVDEVLNVHMDPFDPKVKGVFLKVTSKKAFNGYHLGNYYVQEIDPNTEVYVIEGTPSVLDYYWGKYAIYLAKQSCRELQKSFKDHPIVNQIIKQLDKKLEQQTLNLLKGKFL